MSVSAQMINDLFSQRIGTTEGKEKLAEYGGEYVRDKLREASFARKILPPIRLKPSDCQQSVNHDTLVKIIELEPESRAMTLTFRGAPTAKFIRAERTEAAFYTVSSQMFQKTEQELMAYTMPVTKVLEENMVKDMQEVEDREYLIHCEACVQALQTEANGGSVTSLNATNLGLGAVVEFSVIKGELARTALTNDRTVRPLQKPDLVNLFSLLDDNRLKSDRILMTEGDWNNILSWTVEDNGDKVQSETVVEGYKYNQLMGRSYVRTIKTDILRKGNIYCFTKPEFLGRFYLLNDTKFYIDKVANTITFQAWEDIAMALVNIASVRKLELYSGDATANDADSLQSNFVPVDEDALGAVNNRVAAGLRFPQVDSY